MKNSKHSRVYGLSLLGGIIFASCASSPTLQEVAAMRQNSGKKNTDFTLEYKIADLDVVNYTDKTKEGLARHFNSNTALRYGSATTQVTLATLAGAAKTAGWGVGTASSLGLGAGYIFSLGQVINAKDKAQTYEQAFTAIQAAEATYYFHRLGMSFTTENGHTTVVSSNPNGRNDIPSPTHLTPDGETLYYRVSKILKVLDDALANKIPDLQDLKDAQGDTSTAVKPPAKSGDSPASGGQNPNGTGGTPKKPSTPAPDNGGHGDQSGLPGKTDSSNLPGSTRTIGGGGGQPVTITPIPEASQAPKTPPAANTTPPQNH